MLAGAFIITLLISIGFGIPIAFSLAVGGVAITFFLKDLSLQAFLVVMAQRMFVGTEAFVLLAIPLFIYAGALMSGGGVTRRIIDFSALTIGWMRGGLAMVTIVASSFFAGISGSAAADVAAIGSLMIPAMKSRGYNKNFAAALQGTAGALGPIFPPSILMVIYGMIANVSVAKLFLGGVLPGVVIAFCLMCYCYYVAKRDDYPRESIVSRKEAVKIVNRALLPLGMPVIIMGGILGGVFTPTEAAAVACMYGFVISKFVYRSLPLKNLLIITRDSALETAKVMFIFGISNFVTFLMARGHIPEQVASLLLAISHNPLVILAMINGLLLITACFIEPATALILLAPILLSVTGSLGIDPVFLGVLMVVNLCIGTVTPPVGLSLYIAMGIGDTTLEEISRAIIPFVLVMIIGLLILTYIPSVVMFLPNLLI